MRFTLFKPPAQKVRDEIHQKVDEKRNLEENFAENEKMDKIIENDDNEEMGDLDEKGGDGQNDADDDKSSNQDT